MFAPLIIGRPRPMGLPIGSLSSFGGSPAIRDSYGNIHFGPGLPQAIRETHLYGAPLGPRFRVGEAERAQYFRDQDFFERHGEFPKAERPCLRRSSDTEEDDRKHREMQRRIDEQELQLKILQRQTFEQQARLEAERKAGEQKRRLEADRRASEQNALEKALKASVASADTEENARQVKAYREYEQQAKELRYWQARRH